MLESKIALGTVQFGLSYGVSNTIGKPSKEEVFDLLSTAHKRGINTLDTAYTYGDSEEVIGEFLSRTNIDLNIISKTPPFNSDCSLDPDKYCRQTLSRLKQNSIYGYLIHGFNDRLNFKDLLKRMEGLKQKGWAKKIGVSIYKPQELDYLLDIQIGLDIIQLPYNIFDQRFDEYFLVLRERNIEIHTRSVFLQGLFFLDMDKIVKDFYPAKERIEQLYRLSVDYKIPVYSLCLCFVLINPFIDKVIIGVDSLKQLNQNIDSLSYLDKVEIVYRQLKALKLNDEKIIIPCNWQ